jgi:O-antigen/teichoic acid export membrane protein
VNGEIHARGRERLRRIGLTGAATLGARGLHVAAGLLTIPLTARYLGTERFGVWMLLGSFLSWVGLADLGLTNSITTELAHSDGRNDREGAQVLVSSAFYSLLLIAATVAVLFGLAFPWIPWQRVLNVTGTAALRESTTGVAVTMVLFTARLPLALAGRIYAAYQEGYRFQLWSGGASLLGIAALLLAIHGNSSVGAVLAAFYGTAMLGDVASAVHLFKTRRPWLVPRLASVDRKVSWSLLRVGIVFWIAQIAVILLLQTDLIVVTQLFGVQKVAEYGVALKLFGLVGFVQMAFVGALWPAFAEALARRDQGWIKRVFVHSLYLAVAWSVVASSVLILFGPWLVQTLAAGKLPPDRWLLAAMASTALVTAVGQSFAMLLNAIGEIRMQAILGLASGILNVAVSLLLGKWLGPPGIAIGTTVAVVSTWVVSGGFLRSRLEFLRTPRSATTI